MGTGLTDDEAPEEGHAQGDQQGDGLVARLFGALHRSTGHVREHVLHAGTHIHIDLFLSPFG